LFFTAELYSVQIGVVKVEYPNDTEYIYGAIKPGPNRYPLDTKEKVERLADILESRYGFDTALACKQVNNKTGKVNFYGIGVDVTTQEEMNRFVEALKKENPQIKNLQLSGNEDGKVETQVEGKFVYFVIWKE